MFVAPWLSGYQRPWFKADLVAGLTAAAIVIPKAMAYATIAGIPVQVGLYTAFVPMVVYALLGTSSVLSVSSTTTIAILSAAALGEVTQANPQASLAGATATLCVLVGAILVVARIFRLGYVANFISDPVLTGFKAGIGLVIVVDQVPKLLGIHIHKEGFFHDVLSIFGHVPETSILTLMVAVCTFAVIFVIERFVPRAPAPLVAVAGGVAAAVALGLEQQGVSLVGAIPGGLPAVTMPDLSLALALWPAAAGIALMSFTETITSGRAFSRPGEARPDSNQELVAVGAGNIVGGFFGAMPSGGGTSQTNVNLQAGARTQVAELVTAGTALATMLFLAPVIGAMPNATLAAIVIAYSIGLVSPSEIAAIRRVRTLEFRWAIAAFAGVVLLGTLQGILVAVILSMASLLRLANNPPVRVMGRIPGTHHFRPRTEDHPEDDSIPGLLIARCEGRVYFGNAPVLIEKLRDMVVEQKPRVLLLDCGAIPGFEYTALKMLIDGEARLREEGVELWLAALNPEARELIAKTPLAATLGERMFRTVEQAVEAFQKARP
jgi:high affinity sulfate transporter 1